LTMKHAISMLETRLQTLRDTKDIYPPELQTAIDEEIKELDRAALVLRSWVPKSILHAWEPISNIEWVRAEDLNANDYNPNTVLNQELKLLAFSLLETGWIQPIIAGTDGVIIDGFHRYWLSRNNMQVIKQFGGLVPVVFVDLTPAQRMCMTIRINRAKGVHSSFKMHEIVTKLVTELGMPVPDLCREIGATKDEVELLLQTGVFSALDIQNHKYSQAWKPAK
jgi:hypothetical protein